MQDEIKYNNLVINNSLRIKITRITQNNFNKINIYRSDVNILFITNIEHGNNETN